MSGKLKKTPNSLKTEDLLDIATSDIPEEEIPEYTPDYYKNDVLSFISTFQLEPGDSKIKKHTLFHIYKLWSKDPLEKKSFLIEMAKYFVVPDGRNYYEINQNAVKLTYDAYRKFKKDNNKLKNKRWATHFQDFMKFNALTEGKFWLEKDIVYFLYDKYSHKMKLDTDENAYMTPEVFGYYADIYLPNRKTEKGKMYGLSDNVKNMFQDGQLERMQKDYAKKKKKIYKKK